MTISENFAGCDVSKQHLDLSIGDQERVVLEERFANSPAGIKALVQCLVQHDCRLLVYEPSGGHERAVRLAMRDQHLPGARINARQIREFARSAGCLAKTDRVDARVLCWYGAALRPCARAAAGDSVEQLQALVRRRLQLVEARKKEKQHIHSVTDEHIEEEIEANIAHLGQRIAAYDKRIASHVKADRELARRAGIVSSMQGIGDVATAMLLAEVPELGSISDKAVASLIGVAPHPVDSGAMRGRRKCWGGRKAVRDILYMCALVASRCSNRFKQKYQGLRDRGKPHKVALIAIIRTIMQTLNVMIKNGTKFDPEYSC